MNEEDGESGGREEWTLALMDALETGVPKCQRREKGRFEGHLSPLKLLGMRKGKKKNFVSHFDKLALPNEIKWGKGEDC
jgi:hypothetical protein